MEDSSTKTVNIHYRREKEDYDNWKLYVYIGVDFGESFTWLPDKANPGYVYVTFPFELFGNNIDTIWFKPYKGNWEEEDIIIDRSISKSDFQKSSVNDQTLDIYIRNLDNTIYFSKPQIYSTCVNMYYHRYDNDYSKWSINYFVDKKNNFQRHISDFESNCCDKLFKKLSFNLDYLENSKELHYYVRNNQLTDPVDYRCAPLKETQMDVYMIQDIYQTFSSLEEAKTHLAPQILKAVFHNPANNSKNFNTIWFETNIPLSTQSIDISILSSNLDKPTDKINVLDIRHTDNTLRRFGITVGDNEIKLYNYKYNLKIVSNIKEFNFDITKRISIERLFDRSDFNEKFCYIHENIPMDFGFVKNNSICHFSLWSPNSDLVNLKIYNQPIDGKEEFSLPMICRCGLWYIKIENLYTKKLIGKYYTFEIIENDFVREIIDPYAKTCGINAHRGAIVDLQDSNPPGWINHNRPKGPVHNRIIYELHVKDFTMGKNSTVSSQNQGKFLGLIEKIDYLKKLGINYVQIMPVTKFDTNESVSNGGEYNWGYDQIGLWFIPEGIYCTNPSDPLCRIKEFKEMIMTFHQNGIRVIIDVVHNHTFKTENSLFNSIINGYYYRQHWDSTFSNGSGCGNELHSERPIVGKLIRDYLKYWVKEMGVDGFRFDLMSLTDKFTMESIRKNIDATRPYILLYGEAYTMYWSILPHHLQSSKDNISKKELIEIGAFTDVGSRNAISGYRNLPGLATGASIDSICSHHFYIGQKGEFINNSDQNNPTGKVYNYIDIHDDMLLLDFLKLPHNKMSEKEVLKRYKLAYSMLFNYIGAIVIKSGAEGATTKHKDYNSFRTEDVNLIDWNRMEEYSFLVEYFASYIKFRLSHPAYVMRRKDVNNKFETLDCHRGYIKGKMFKDYANGDPFNKLLIYHNLSKSDLEVSLPCQKGDWAVVCNDTTAGNIRIGNPLGGKIVIPNLTTIVLADNNSVEKIKLSQNDPLSYLFLKIKK